MLCYRTTVQLSAEVQMNFDLRSEAEMLMQITCVTVNGNTFLYYVISWKVRSIGAFQLAQLDPIRHFSHTAEWLLKFLIVLFAFIFCNLKHQLQRTKHG